MKRALMIMIGLASYTSQLPAQEDSRLVAAVRLAQDGKGDSARSIVLDLITQTPVTDTLFPQLVYTMGMVARDAADRSRNFRRVAVEFAGSAWADDALLGLAQEDFAAGRTEASARNIERIRSDYPTSSLLPVAAYWGARAYFELRNNPEACRWLAQGQAIAGEDVELLNQLNYYAPRCAAGAGFAAESASRPDTAYPAVPTPAPAATSSADPPVQVAPAAGRFTVQVAAASTEAAAQGTVASLRAAGYEPHLVREGGFIKVRVGQFSTRTEAVASATQVRSKMGGSPFVVEEQ